MARNQRAQSTAGANGPRADEAEKNTPDVEERNPLTETFDEALDGFFTGAEVGDEEHEENPQERRGLGLSSNIGYSDRRAYADPYIGAHDAGLPDDNGLDFMEEPRNLRAPAPREGYTQCWIDWFTPDGRPKENAGIMLRRGWTPRDPGTISPAEAAFYEKRTNFDGSDMICAAGQVLCEMPEKHMRMIEQREQMLHERNERASLDPVRAANRTGSNRGANMRIGVTSQDD